ncbi:MAG: bifunctional nuclease family protein [Candidatus Latescibacteria bacterium]|jgi:uncharacterized protein|nr:bifunctional nuclease family protein [Candidatus Latescibacterota bacterium]MBT4137968.1 bifunctional nuclease family protein [Candidatus Latescibacterota bacterium]MBT5832465.1 bifunctional nuclease family protein [Candidatus Latescibacterota bacterium]
MTFQAEISGLFIDRKNGEAVLMLKEQEGTRTLPIWIQMEDMFSVAIQLSNGQFNLPRPFAHDLIKTIVHNLQAKVGQVVITDIEDYIYYAQVTIVSPEKSLKFDARPSDAILMALKFDAPICIVEEVVEKQVALIEDAGLTEETLFQRLQKIQPEDIINHSA